LVIDSSAILAIFFREKEAEALLSAILEADFAGIGSPPAAETGLVLTSRLLANATGSSSVFLRRPGSRSCLSPIFTVSERSTRMPGSERAAIRPL